ncbi:MAG: Two component transcriptional regulator, winged helix family [Parcubacteria group bacterium GW2011_GWC1_38_17]|nr:MAG: Two component transcriptional regulator, winged helix family [Parcubacteria group bacterium GW2011_GWC1_38_17]
MDIMKNKIKIVLVEDDQFLSKILILRLVEEGFDVVLADNGQDAAGVIKKENPNIVLLDLLLPKKNGFEVLEEIKLDAKINQIPVIILSNLGQQTDINKGLKLGATDYLVKANFGIKDIVSKIKEHLAKI